MQDELVEIIDQPGSPNLYWALASLPRPLVEFLARNAVRNGHARADFPLP